MNCKPCNRFNVVTQQIYSTQMFLGLIGKGTLLKRNIQFKETMLADKHDVQSEMQNHINVNLSLRPIVFQFNKIAAEELNAK